MSINLEVPLEMMDEGDSSSSTELILLPRSYLYLDSDDYDGATYTFEIVAINTNLITAYDVDLYDVDGAAVKATITVPADTSLPTRFRSGSWTPADATNRTYGVRLAQTADADHLKVYVARIIVTQVNATKTRIQIPLINYDLSLTNFDVIDQTSSASYVQAAPGVYSYYKKDTSVLSGISNWSLEAVLYSDNAAKTAYLGLFNATDGVPVTGAEVSVLGTTPTLVSVDFANNAANFDEGDTFEGRIKSSTAEYFACIQKAALYCRLTSLAKAEIFWRVGRENNQAVAAETYPNGRILLNTSILSNPTIYLEASAICADNAQIVFLRDHLLNDSGEDGSPVADSGLNFSGLQDFYNTEDNGNAGLPNSTDWKAQIFTANESYDIYSVKLKLWYSAGLGLPGIVTVSIRNTDGAGNPIGGDLCVGTTDGDTLPTSSPGEWREIIFSSPYPLVEDLVYVVVLRSEGTGGFSGLCWRYNSAGTYIGGGLNSSNDSGENWQGMTPTNDAMFETYEDAVKVRIRSGALTLTDDDRFYAYKEASTNILYLSNCWVIVDVAQIQDPVINPYPDDEESLLYDDWAEYEAGDRVLRWEEVGDPPVGYWIYFKKEGGAYGEGIFLAGQIWDFLNVYATEPLEVGKYYWRVDSDYLELGAENAVPGTEWTFTIAGVAPTIDSQDPAVDTTVDEGDSVSLSVVATGTPIPEYEWWFDDGDGYDIIPGESNPTLTFTADRTDAGSYKCRAYNGVGEDAWSDPIVLTVHYPVEITVQPVNLVVPEGLLATFSVTAIGVPDPEYQWYKDDVELPGETNSTLSFYTTFASAGIYTCEVSN